MPKIYSKSIRAGQEVEKEAGSNRILVMETGSTSHLNRRLLFHDLVAFPVDDAVVLPLGPETHRTISNWLLIINPDERF